tara:strand:+ start:7871 stop:8143 length:273 start_codon:yes stop_codon:yes gene_type:complete
MTKSEQPGYAKTIHREKSPFTLDQLQKLVGGYIEVLELKDNTQLIINEEGKMMGLPYNDTATQIMHYNFGRSADYVVGDAIILHGKAKLR